MQIDERIEQLLDEFEDLPLASRQLFLKKATLLTRTDELLHKLSDAEAIQDTSHLGTQSLENNPQADETRTWLHDDSFSIPIQAGAGAAYNNKCDLHQLGYGKGDRPVIGRYLSKYLHASVTNLQVLLESLVTKVLDQRSIPLVHGCVGDRCEHPWHATYPIESQPLSVAIHALHYALFATLQDRMSWLQPLLRRFVTVCNTIHAAHQKGIMHGSLSVDCIALTLQGDTYVLNWANAKCLTVSPRNCVEEHLHDMVAALEHNIRDFGLPRGDTHCYMSPEQTCGTITGTASDVYSLGAILYHLLRGQPPQSAVSNDEVARKVEGWTSDHSPFTSLTYYDELRAICTKAMSLRADDRYQSCNEFSVAIGSVIDSPQVTLGAHGEEVVQNDGMGRTHNHSRIANLDRMLMSRVFESSDVGFAGPKPQDDYNVPKSVKRPNRFR